MQSAVRDLQSTQRQASTKLRDALGDMQQMELAPRPCSATPTRSAAAWGQYAVMSESQVTQAM